VLIRVVRTNDPIEAESTRSQSGKVSFGIVLPEMIPLSVGVADPDATHPEDLLQHGPIGEDGLSQLGPILPIAAPDDIVNGGER
jgi:hypothetical protein